MKPFHTLAEARTPEGRNLKLHEHDGDYFILLNGQQLMNSRASSSEHELARLACRHLEGIDCPRILIGGLGLGFTLKGVLDLVGPDAVVQVAELIPEIVSWNREYLEGLNGDRLADDRVGIIVADVYEVIRRAADRPYDAILLDVDNGPVAFVLEENRRIYQAKGIAHIVKALRPNGCVAVWSAGKDRSFADRLFRAGLKVDVVGVKAYPNAPRDAHVVFLGRKRPGD